MDQLGSHPWFLGSFGGVVFCLSAWLPILAVMWGDRTTLAFFCFSICLALLFCLCVDLGRALLYYLSFACVCVCIYISADLGIGFEVIHYTGSSKGALVSVSSLFMWGRSVLKSLRLRVNLGCILNSLGSKEGQSKKDKIPDLPCNLCPFMVWSLLAIQHDYVDSAD